MAEHKKSEEKKEKIDSTLEEPEVTGCCGRKVDIDNKSDDKGPLKVILGIIGIMLIVFVLFFASFRYFSARNQEKAAAEAFMIESETSYNDFNLFKANDGTWYLNIQVRGRDTSHMVELKYSPWEVEWIPVEENVKEQLAGSDMIYLTVDPNMTGKTVVAMINLGRVLGTRYDIYNKETKGALTRIPDSGYDGVTPVITCDNASSSQAVVLFRIGDTAEVLMEDSCVIVQGATEEEIRMAADRATYAMLNVIQ